MVKLKPIDDRPSTKQIFLVVFFFSNYYTYISKFLLIQCLDILLQNSILLLPGVFTCGPCPVRAIRNGDLYLGYDTKFLFAEVNGDRVFWTVDSEGNMTPVFKDIDVVGKFMSTKAVNTISRDDVTSKYKHETGIRVLTHFLHSFSKFLNRLRVFKRLNGQQIIYQVFIKIKI